MKNQLFFLASMGFLSLFLCSAGCNEPMNADKNQGEVNNDAASNQEPQKAQEMEALNAKVKITTPYGVMIAKLYDETPKHRDNFIKLVEEGFYNDLLFHRVIKGFMIQGGDPDSRNAAANQRLGMGGPGYTVEAEIRDEFVHLKGALSAARQGDQVNPEKRSSGSQFYIVQGAPTQPQMLMGLENRMNMKRDSSNLFRYSEEMVEAYQNTGGTPHLDGEYTVFAQVVEGLEIIDSIAAVPTARGDRPLEDVKFTIEVIKP